MEREDEIVPYYSIQARQRKSRISCLTYRRAAARYAASKPITQASAKKDAMHAKNRLPGRAQKKMRRIRKTDYPGERKKRRGAYGKTYAPRQGMTDGDDDTVESRSQEHKNYSFLVST